MEFQLQSLRTLNKVDGRPFPTGAGDEKPIINFEDRDYLRQLRSRRNLSEAQFEKLCVFVRKFGGQIDFAPVADVLARIEAMPVEAKFQDAFGVQQGHADQDFADFLTKQAAILETIQKYVPFETLKQSQDPKALAYRETVERLRSEAAADREGKISNPQILPIICEAVFTNGLELTPVLRLARQISENERTTPKRALLLQQEIAKETDRAIEKFIQPLINNPAILETIIQAVSTENLDMDQVLGFVQQIPQGLATTPERVISLRKMITAEIARQEAQRQAEKLAELAAQKPPAEPTPVVPSVVEPKSKKGFFAKIKLWKGQKKE